MSDASSGTWRYVVIGLLALVPAIAYATVDLFAGLTAAVNVILIVGAIALVARSRISGAAHA